ncbi:MAG: hypothetical protein Q8P97_01500 [bacterium]|nr:hypothetical protein [bacterium]
MWYNDTMVITNEMQQMMAKLYEVDQLSMVQIADKLNISPASVRHYLDKAGIKRRSISEAVTAINITRFNKVVFKLKSNLSITDKELKIAGAMLYWGEGAKGGGTVKFANSDPEMIKVFLCFLRKVCGIHEERLKALIHMYPDHNEQKLQKFWSSVTKISKNRFYKSYVHVGRVGTYKYKSLYGTLALNYSDKRLLETILFWINEYRHTLDKPE